MVLGRFGWFHVLVTTFVVRHFETLMAGSDRACLAVFETCHWIVDCGRYLDVYGLSFMYVALDLFVVLICLFKTPLFSVDCDLKMLEMASKRPTFKKFSKDTWPHMEIYGCLW